MFFTGAVGALLMYSVLKSTNNRHSGHEQRMPEHDPVSQSMSERVARGREKYQEESNSPSLEPESLKNEQLLPRVIYVPQEIVREVVVNCSCRCACKAPELPEVRRSFWSLDQGRFVRSAGNREARETQEKRRMELMKMTTYWNLDQGMHADEKGTV